jgi:hypothetical protein
MSGRRTKRFQRIKESEPVQRKLDEAIQKTGIRPLLSPEAAAKIIGVAVGTLEVWRCTKRYDLPWCKMGGRVRYRPEDIETFIESRKSTGAAA